MAHSWRESNADMPKRAQEPSVTLNVRMPQALFDQLKQLGGEGGMSAIVRRTLEAGLAAEAPATGDEKTGELLRFVADAAKALDESYDQPWHANVFLTQALRDAITPAVEQIGAIGPRDEGGAPVNWLTPEEWQEVQAPMSPNPGSIVDKLLLHPSMRFRELSVELLADALYWLRVHW
jgi:hypothetical protein